jgi:hypothetical protein
VPRGGGRAEGTTSPRFRSAAELREILEAVLEQIDSDPEAGPRMRAAAAPLRLEFRDLKLALNISVADGGDRCLRWDFSRRSSSRPKLRLSMDSEFANRLLQGKENPVIAIARGTLSTTVSDAGAALRFFPAARPLFSRYRELVAQRYPHLALD